MAKPCAYLCKLLQRNVGEAWRGRGFGEMADFGDMARRRSCCFCSGTRRIRSRGAEACTTAVCVGPTHRITARKRAQTGAHRHANPSGFDKSTQRSGTLISQLTICQQRTECMGNQRYPKLKPHKNHRGKPHTDTELRSQADRTRNNQSTSTQERATKHR